MWEEGSYFSLSPTYFETKSEEEIEKKVAFTALAVAKTGKRRSKEEKRSLSDMQRDEMEGCVPFARWVFPVPGG